MFKSTILLGMGLALSMSLMSFTASDAVQTTLENNKEFNCHIHACRFLGMAEESDLSLDSNDYDELYEDAYELCIGEG